MLAAFLFSAILDDEGASLDVTLQIRNLSNTLSEDDLKTLFTQAGDVTAVRIVRDRTSGKSRGFGFVVMSAQSEADRAVSRFNHHLLQGLALMVSLAKPRLVRDTVRPRSANI